ncbi:MAG: hypothetical protein JO360_00055 [Acidobacteria bacterium]|nr:hypothetical protein [Acidobacteriota bacterium]
MTPTRESTQEELVRRHRSAVMMVGATLGLTVALMMLGYLHKFPLIPASYSLAQALWVAIAVFGLGSIVLRRTRFAAMRLQDIAALRGMSGLLAALQNTTLLLAVLSGAVAVMGFINTMMTNDWMHIRNAGVIAIGVLLYSYPSRTAWQRLVEGIERKGLADSTSAKGNIT